MSLFQQRHVVGGFPRSMEGFVTLDEVGDEEDADHQKQRKAGLVKSENSGTENPEETEQENGTLGNCVKSETAKVETSDAANAVPQETEKNADSDVQETKPVPEKRATVDEHRVGPYQPNVPVGKTTFSAGVVCIMNYVLL